MHEREQEEFEESVEDSDESSVHIDETVSVAQQAVDAKFQVPNQTDYDDGAALARSLHDEKESLQSEMLKLCNEIENANGTSSSSNSSSVDLTYQEEKDPKNIVDKV